jgi:hypothetical protein
MYGYFPNPAGNFATLNATLNALLLNSHTLPQIRPHHVAAGALKAHQQSVVCLAAAVAGFQVVLHLRQQMRGHLGIGQGPVRTA